MKKTPMQNAQVGKKEAILEFECYSENHKCHVMVLLLLISQQYFGSLDATLSFYSNNG